MRNHLTRYALKTAKTEEILDSWFNGHVSFRFIQNDINHCAYIHSVMHVCNYAVVLKSTIQRANTQFIMTLCIVSYTIF